MRGGRDSFVQQTDRLTGAHLYRRDALARKVAQVRADLEGKDASPAERLLAEQAAVCWLAAYEADLASGKSDAFVGEKAAEYVERRRDRAHRRFLQAVKALAVLRRLAVPARRPVPRGIHRFPDSRAALP